MQTSPSIAIVILAAGPSSRLGTPKQLLGFQGESLLRRTVRAALSVSGAEVMLLLGFKADDMTKEVTDLPVRIVLNPAWEEGIASSIRAGIQSLSPSIEAAMFLVCDQPYITGELLQNIARAYAASGKPMVACEYEGIVGVPALFARGLFDRLLRLHGNSGARAVLQQDPDDVFRIPFPQGTVDIDTIQDYQNL